MSHAHTYTIKHTEFQCITSQGLCITSQGLCMTSQGLCVISQGYIPGIMQHIPGLGSYAFHPRDHAVNPKKCALHSKDYAVNPKDYALHPKDLSITSQGLYACRANFCCAFVLAIFTHILQDYFTGTGAISRLPKCQRSKPEGYLYINHHPGNDENQQQNKPQQNCAHVSWHKLFSLTPFTKLSFYWQSN